MEGSIADMSSGMPAGPAGCGGAVFVFLFVVAILAAAGFVLWWLMRDMGL